jgi:uncharacterized protein
MFGKKKTNYFYDQFALVGKYSLRAMETLKKGFDDFDNTDSLALKNSVHAIEHDADRIKHETEERLGKEFMTPIDREDIFLLLDAIDDLTDAIDEISYKTYVHNYRTLPPDCSAFLDNALQAVTSVEELLTNLNHVTEKRVMDPMIEGIRGLEERTDHLYEEHVHDLYKNHPNDPTNLKNEDIYGMFEELTDRCRDITKVVEIIMYKNL